MSDVKAVMFDLDGTLIPTMQGFADIAASVIERRYQWPSAKARRAYLDTSGIAFFKQLDVIFPGDSRNPNAAEEFETRKQAHFFDHRFTPKVVTTLKELNRRGYRTAVSSNNFEWLVQRFIGKAGPGLFDCVCGYRDGFAKGKEHFDEIERRFGAAREEMLFVADSLSDLRMAREEGVHFIGMEGTFTREEFLAADPAARTVADLLKLLSLLPERDAGEMEAQHGRPRVGRRLWNAP